MTSKKLWSPSTTNNNINNFTKFVSLDKKFEDYKKLHQWSVEQKEIFWDKIWIFTKLIGEKKGEIYK